MLNTLPSLSLTVIPVPAVLAESSASAAGALDSSATELDSSAAGVLESAAELSAAELESAGVLELVVLLEQPAKDRTAADASRAAKILFFIDFSSQNRFHFVPEGTELIIKVLG
jgi:hypothetical protein